MLSPDELQKIESIFSQRANMQPVSSWLPLQAPANPSQILELRRLDANNYSLHSVRSRGAILPPPNGRFIFVIPTSSPGKVYCGTVKVYRGAYAPGLIEPVAGHTSISKGRDVLFAGEIHFNNGALIKWSNYSGHYTPAAALIDSNMIPAIKLLLPHDKFERRF